MEFLKQVMAATLAVAIGSIPAAAQQQSNITLRVASFAGPFGEGLQAVAVGAGNRSGGRHAGARMAAIARGQRGACRKALHVPLEGSRSRLVEVVQVESEVPLGRGVEAEVREVAIAAELDAQTSGRR